MTATIQLYGRLGRDPEQRTTAAGKPMVTASMVVDLGRDGKMPEWFNLLAFRTVGEALAKHVKGDMVAVSGKLTKSTWTGKDGMWRTGFSVCVDTLASARTVRPQRKLGGKREQVAAEEFNDAIPF